MRRNGPVLRHRHGHPHRKAALVDRAALRRRGGAPRVCARVDAEGNLAPRPPQVRRRASRARQAAPRHRGAVLGVRRARYRQIRPSNRLARRRLEARRRGHAARRRDQDGTRARGARQLHGLLCRRPEARRAGQAEAGGAAADEARGPSASLRRRRPFRQATAHRRGARAQAPSRAQRELARRCAEKVAGPAGGRPAKVHSNGTTVLRRHTHQGHSAL
mmetsp:Transcript_7198/g.23453  ORF Transcript_7198/g.23453 Transcript_7198/m.23453 type:complete len:218 (+) Transcript_7198:879-1532(+)